TSNVGYINRPFFPEPLGVSIPKVTTPAGADDPNRRSISFNSTETLPFLAVNPSAAFAESPNPMSGMPPFGSGPAPVTAGAGLGTSSLGTVNGGLSGTAPNVIPSGPDIQFQADGSNSFTARCVGSLSGVINGVQTMPEQAIVSGNPLRSPAVVTPETLQPV